MDVKLFQHLRDAGEAGISDAALFEKSGVEVVLLQRLMRHLASMHLVTYHDGAFRATTMSNAMAEERYQHSISFCYDVSRPSFNGFPDLFKSTGYKAPTLGGTDGPFQYAHHVQVPFFDWLVSNPQYLQYFDSFMSAYRAGKPNWFDPGFYPVPERLIAGFDASVSDVLLVDVGGGQGHDVAAFVARHGSQSGKIVLQDREPVISAVKAANEVRQYEVQAHDFFTPQPVKGARAYSLHSILHDWSDEDGVKIVQNLVPALTRGYSKVLFNEIVVSEENPTLAATSMDMMMLAHFAVRERTESSWREVLQKGGLKIVNIYTYPGVAESVIEAELA